MTRGTSSTTTSTTSTERASTTSEAPSSNSSSWDGDLDELVVEPTAIVDEAATLADDDIAEWVRDTPTGPRHSGPRSSRATNTWRSRWARTDPSVTT